MFTFKRITSSAVLLLREPGACFAFTGRTTVKETPAQDILPLHAADFGDVAYN